MFHPKEWTEKGQGLVEYAVVLSLVATIALAVVHSETLQQKIADVFALAASLFDS